MDIDWKDRKLWIFAIFLGIIIVIAIQVLTYELPSQEPLVINDISLQPTIIGPGFEISGLAELLIVIVVIRVMFGTKTARKFLLGKK
jgi:hypothetical protein